MYKSPELPSITTCTTSELQTQYLCSVARTLQTYPLNLNHKPPLVLPPTATAPTAAIVFPQLELSPQFWQKLQRAPTSDICSVYPADCLIEAKQFSTWVSPLTQDTAVHTFDTAIELSVRSFLSELCQIFPQKIMQQVETITLLPSAIGFPSMVCTKRLRYKKYEIVCAFRTDVAIPVLLEALLYGFISIEQETIDPVISHATQVNAAIVEFFKCHTRLQTFFPATHPIIVPREIVELSSRYLEQLGLHDGANVAWQVFADTLTEREKIGFKLLYERTGSVVPFSELVVAIWGKTATHKVSSYSLAKLIENLRHKLILFGHYRQHLYCVRKQGYMFVR